MYKSSPRLGDQKAAEMDRDLRNGFECVEINLLARRRGRIESAGNVRRVIPNPLYLVLRLEQGG
jgi:hypothetical protein